MPQVGHVQTAATNSSNANYQEWQVNPAVKRSIQFSVTGIVKNLFGSIWYNAGLGCAVLGVCPHRCILDSVSQEWFDHLWTDDCSHLANEMQALLVRVALDAPQLNHEGAGP